MAVEPLILGISDGMTLLRGRGVWRDDRGRILRESVTVFETYLPPGLSTTAWQSFIQGLRVLANEWREQAILLIVDDRRILVPGARYLTGVGDLAVWKYPRPRWAKGAR